MATKQFKINVTARVKPFFEQDQTQNCEEVLLKKCKSLGFSKVADTNITQNDIFNDSVKNQMDSFINGYNCTILAYGQTGSGKTHTIFGPPNCIHQYKFNKEEQKEKEIFIEQVPGDWGLFPRSMNYLLQQCNALQNEGSIKNVKISLQAVEIYLECIYDLMDDSKQIAISSAGKMKSHVADCVEHRTKATYDANGKWVNPEESLKQQQQKFEIKGAKELDIKELKNVIDFQKIVETLRISKGHDINARSSRSHCVITISLAYQKTDTKDLVKSKFLFIDLAGSERISRSGVSGQKQKESTATNLSLTILGRCINAIAQKQFIPYRDSQLTMLIKDSFNGNTRTGLFITMSSEQKYLDESILSLQFGQRSSTITNNVKVNSQQSQGMGLFKKAIQKEILKKQQDLKLLEEKGMNGYMDTTVNKKLQESFLSNKNQLELNKEKLMKIKQKISELKCDGKQDTQQFKIILQDQAYVMAEIEKYNGIVLRQISTGLYKMPQKAYINQQRQLEALQQELKQLECIKE